MKANSKTIALHLNITISLNANEQTIQAKIARRV